MDGSGREWEGVGVGVMGGWEWDCDGWEWKLLAW